MKPTLDTHLNHRFDVLQTVLEQNQHDLKGRMMDGLGDLKILLAEMNHDDPEALSQALTQALRPRETGGMWRRLKMGMLGITVALGLIGSSLALLWLGQQQIMAHLEGNGMLSRQMIHGEVFDVQ